MRTNEAVNLANTVKHKKTAQKLEKTLSELQGLGNTLLQHKKLTEANFGRFRGYLDAIKNEIGELKDLPRITQNELNDLEDRINEHIRFAISEIPEVEMPKFDTKPIEEKIKALKKELLQRINTQGGGQANRRIDYNSSVVSKRYADINFLAGTNASIAAVDNTTTKQADVTLGVVNIPTFQAIQFNPQPSTLAHSEGQIHWDDDSKTLQADLEVTDVQLQIGQETHVRATNKTGSVIGNGSVVYINGAQGNRPTIALADADAAATSDATIGLATHDIADNGTGYVTEVGLVNDIDTSPFSAGDVVYVSSTAGQLTNVKPLTPKHLTEVGTVVTSNASEGKVLVNVKNLPHLEDLHDVLITSPANNQIIRYDEGLGYWVNDYGASEKSWAFASRVGASGTIYAGGFLFNSGTSNNFSPSVNFGTAGASYAAHLYIVTGQDTEDELTITVTGTSINDSGTRTTSDSEAIVIPNATSAGAFYETDKKWLGQVAIEATGGTAKLCDYGFGKYWDNNNTDYQVTGLEATWLGGANDTGADIKLIHYDGTAGNTNWTYTGSGATPPTPIAAMATDHTATDNGVVNGENGAWKRSNLSYNVDGSASEGTIIEIDTTANKAFELGTFIMRIEPQ